jgi:hypothetical protein
MGEYQISLTRHAANMLAERDIESEWVDRTIHEPDALEPDSDRNDVFVRFVQFPNAKAACCESFTR